CRRITPCQPARTWRAHRGIWVKAFTVLMIGCLAFLLYGKHRWQFISPGALSSPHASNLFHKRALQAGMSGEDCSSCHKAAQGGPLTWASTAQRANPFDVKMLFAQKKPELTKIDRSCMQCHSGHSFHQKNVAWDYSCSECHQEHKGSGSMMRVQSENCSFCHGNATLMPASRTVHAFEVDHPEFRLIRDKARDPDTLRFSHKTHQASNPRMVQMSGRKLDCLFCHKPGGTGEYYQSVSFAENCQVCHSLQFDKRNSDLALPHGDSRFVHAYLRSLPAQYADYAARVKMLRDPKAIEQFVQGELAALRTQFGSGEELEEKVFFSTEISGPIADPARLGSRGRSLFPGCAYCHEVRRASEGPAITPPIIPTRWLNHGKFDHARHTSFQCAECHKVSASMQASDILLPSQKACITCHSPKGGARNDCAACHWYHNDEKTGLKTISQPAN
ncbi:MAG: hypothetical protein JWM99_1018, partial [Verrucomicrobiales bacterium]|nr:hypothetical protein [Verrucomicrobiales bacterium]